MFVTGRNVRCSGILCKSIQYPFSLYSNIMLHKGSFNIHCWNFPKSTVIPTVQEYCTVHVYIMHEKCYYYTDYINKYTTECRMNSWTSLSFDNDSLINKIIAMHRNIRLIWTDEYRISNRMFVQIFSYLRVKKKSSLKLNLTRRMKGNPAHLWNNSNDKLYECELICKYTTGKQENIRTVNRTAICCLWQEIFKFTYCKRIFRRRRAKPLPPTVNGVESGKKVRIRPVWITATVGF
jgi:hypothetical protein